MVPSLLEVESSLCHISHKNAMLKKCTLSSFLKTAGLAAAQMSGGSEFNMAGLAQSYYSVETCDNTFSHSQHNARRTTELSIADTDASSLHNVA